MPFFEGFELITYAQNEELDNKLFFRWVMGYQNTMSFEEFKNRVRAGCQTEDDRDADEILSMVKGIIG